MAEKKSKLAEIKTKPSSVSVKDFINAVPDEQKRNDSFSLFEMMQKIAGETAVLWGSSIIGFGNKRYKSPTSGREVDWFLIGFSPKKANITVYLMEVKAHSEALEKLGKHKLGGGCLYINKLGDVDLQVLEGLIKKAFDRNKS
jgi:hypothetical protein